MVINNSHGGTISQALLTRDIYTMPTAGSLIDSLSTVGRQAFMAMEPYVRDFNQQLNKLADTKSILGRVFQLDGDSIYAVYNFDDLYTSVGITRDFMACHPAIVEYYKDGGEAFSAEYTPPEDHEVYYARAMDGIVSPDTGTIVYSWDHGYPNVPKISEQDQITIARSYQILESKILKNLDEYVWEGLEEVDEP